jgi:hypothetical protein
MLFCSLKDESKKPPLPPHPPTPISFVEMVKSNQSAHVVAATALAKFIVPDWRDKVDSGICMVVMSYRPTRLHRLAGRATTLCRSQLYHPVRDYEFGYCGDEYLPTPPPPPQSGCLPSLFHHPLSLSFSSL